jgi:predicted DNA repair protein MutK
MLAADMKTPLIYGLYMALAGLVLNLGLYFTGFHSDVDKLGTAQTVATVGNLILGVGLLVLGVKARRAEIPATENFGYGRALWAGVQISFFACVFGIITNFLYMNVINRGLRELMVQAQITKWEALGMSSDNIEKAEKMMRTMMNPALQAVFGLIFGMIICTVISLVVAAFLKRPAQADLTSPPMAA